MSLAGPGQYLAAALGRLAPGSLAAAATLALGLGTANAQFEAQQCFDALMTSSTGLKQVAEKPGASAADYNELLTKNIDLGVASGQPLIYIAELWDMSQLSPEDKAATRDKLAKLRSAIAEYIVVLMADELRRVTPVYLMEGGHFLPPKVIAIRPIGSPPDRYAIEITSPTGGHGKPLPLMSLLVSSADCKLFDLSLGDSSFLVSVGQDLKAIGDLAEAERQLRTKIAEIAASS